MRRIFTAALFALMIAGPTTVQAHQGHTSRAPWEVCDTAELGADCEWHDEAGATYIGTCRAVADDLMCVRNRPIVPGGGEHTHNDEGGPHAH